MKSLLRNEIVLLVGRLLVGTVFIVASIEKIAIPELFASSIQAYQMLPAPLINMFAIWLSWVELVAGVLLIAGVAVRASAVVISAMLALFIVGLVAAILRGLEIDCGCFGGMSQTPVGWQKVLEDIGLLLVSLHLAFHLPARFTLQSPPPEDPS